MKKRVKKNIPHNIYVTLILRYLILLFLVTQLPFIYKILTPITTNAVGEFLRLFYQVSIHKDIINVNITTTIQIVSACVAGSAYLLLLILNLTVPLNTITRIKSILLSMVLLFIVNVIRIVFLTYLLVIDFPYFDFTHKFFWYFLSTIFVIIIWILTIKLFKIKDVPVYTDFKMLMKDIKKK